MKNRTHLYVDRKNIFTWLMAISLVLSVALRIYSGVTSGIPAQGSWFSGILLPILAAILYLLIVLLCGKEFFYKTSLSVILTCIYLSVQISNCELGKLTTIALILCLFGYAFFYHILTSSSANKVWVLVPLTALVLGFAVYFRRFGDFSVLSVSKEIFLADVLMIGGWLLMLLGLQVHPLGEYHPTWGDRADGRRIRTQPPMDQVSPYIMVTRNSANNIFRDSIEISNIERYIRKKRAEGYSGLGINHILLAGYVRCVAQYPALNRFVSGQKVYTHGDDIQYCMTVKKEMRVDSPDTVIKVHLNPRDTLDDVYRKFNAAIDEVRNSPLDSSFDNVAHIFTMIPGLALKFAVWLLTVLDYFGMIPKFLLEVSPFHGSIFFTSMGSLGIPPVFHHLYDFGNLPIFCAFGCKYHKTELDIDGNPIQKKYVDVTFNVDERIVDGYYYAAFFKQFKRIIAHPEQLELPPEVVKDDID